MISVLSYVYTRVDVALSLALCTEYNRVGLFAPMWHGLSFSCPDRVSCGAKNANPITNPIHTHPKQILFVECLVDGLDGTL